MSHVSVIAALKALIKVQPEAIEITRYVENLRKESDRGAIILAATALDDALATALQRRMPSLNSDERQRMFSYDGQAGSFSGRIRLAFAMDIIDRPVRRHIEVVKEMRNTAAHAHDEVTFDTPAVRAATGLLLHKTKLQH